MITARPEPIATRCVPLMIATDRQLPENVSRRQFLKGAGALAGGVVVAGGAFETVSLLSGTGLAALGPRLPSYQVRASGPVRQFHSRPDLRPPTITLTSAADSSDGYMFLARGVARATLTTNPGR